MIYVFLFIILLNNYFTFEDYITKKNFKRSVDQINNFVLNFPEISDSKIDIRKKRKIITTKNSKWPLTIYYYYESRINSVAFENVEKIIEKVTCIKLYKSRTNRFFLPGIRYKYTGNCSSAIGNIYKNEWQDIEIGPRCNNFEGILHETLHALGLYHEQCRFDRDFFVKIYKENMLQNETASCVKHTAYEGFHYHLSYDYGSIMHAAVNAFAIGNRKTIIPTDPFYEGTMGQTQRLSFNDIKVLNLHYCAHPNCPFKRLCYNYGYQDPHHCHLCKCIEGFWGTRCEKFRKNQRNCWKTIVLPDRMPRLFSITGIKKCDIHFVVNKTSRIKFNILKAYMFPNTYPTCQYENTIEVKYWMDKSVTGARFCHQTENKTILSHNNHIIFHYRSTQKINFAKIFYLEIY
ncbi:Astacin-like metalloendopeptidase [Strongyloides ratti]|uniref:Metalloendopeptidase n=1 Tax=Strongyloides ratti TaxID=34506 RepID=A0A090LLD0_STRRB|nr:Astacin-like metalloendopeptidase [Strongyloides ratti]CEF70619.1 Astacin-like metalloendopeptidase [Strongyloides ratti]